MAFSGSDPSIPCPFPVGEAAAAVLGAIGAEAAVLWAARTGSIQDVEVDVGRAAASLLSLWLARLDGQSLSPVPASGNPTDMSDDPVVALHRAGDGRWVHLHGAFPHLRAGTLAVLGCGDGPAEIAAAVAAWKAEDLEAALGAAGMCGAMARSTEEWLAHPQGRAVAALPPVDVVKIADGPPEPVPLAGRPLGGIRVLEMARILAGPVCGRVLGEHGADVLAVSAPDLPDYNQSIIDTGHGKRSAHLDLRRPADHATLLDLVAGADVVSQGYRTGALSRKGLGPAELAAVRPGLVYVSINTYGPDGPWVSRPGWEHMAQTVSGMAVAQGGVGGPATMPVAVCDYITGYLAALGAMVALRRRAQEGGSYHVRASLCQTALWVQEFGRYPAIPDVALGDTSRWMTQTDTPFGRLRHLTPVVQLAETPARWSGPPVPPGTHRPVWPDRRPPQDQPLGQDRR